VRTEHGALSAREGVKSSCIPASRSGPHASAESSAGAGPKSEQTSAWYTDFSGSTGSRPQPPIAFCMFAQITSCTYLAPKPAPGPALAPRPPRGRPRGPPRSRPRSRPWPTPGRPWDWPPGRPPGRPRGRAGPGPASGPGRSPVEFRTKPPKRRVVASTRHSLEHRRR
jgi:hypothetical protein